MPKKNWRIIADTSENGIIYSTDKKGNSVNIVFAALIKLIIDSTYLLAVAVFYVQPRRDQRKPLTFKEVMIINFIPRITSFCLILVYFPELSDTEIVSLVVIIMSMYATMVLTLMAQFMKPPFKDGIEGKTKI